MIKKYYIVTNLNSEIEKKIKNYKKINIIIRVKNTKEDNIILNKIIKSNIYNKIFIANNYRLGKSSKISGLYLSSFNKEPLKNNRCIIGSSHSIREIMEKKRAECSIIFVGPVFDNKYVINGKKLGIIKFLLIAKNFNTKIYPMGGIINPKKLKDYGIFGFAGTRFFENKNQHIY
jgi:thiamine monophosphate synthase